MRARRHVAACLLILVAIPCGPAAHALSSEGLYRRVIALNRIQEPDLDVIALEAALTGLVAQTRARLAAASSPAEQVAVLNRCLLADRPVSYLSRLYWRDATLAAALLRQRGNCLATSTLYALVAARLELPVGVVLVPGHAFVRWDDGRTRINIETTAGGRRIDDAAYLRRARAGNPIDREAFGWGRTLSAQELLAELTRVAAMHRRATGELGAACAMMREVLTLVPDRLDHRLLAITLQAEYDGDRSGARRAVRAILERDPPPSVAVDALRFLANEAAAAGAHRRERALLRRALACAPDSSRRAVHAALASCHRSLDAHADAVHHQRRAVALCPPASRDRARQLGLLAACLKDAGQFHRALDTVARARAINPEDSHLALLEAGCLVLAGRREAGEAHFTTLEPPTAGQSQDLILRAWYHAVCGEREAFYRAFEAALAGSHSPYILIWLDQDGDLDPYRDETRFRRLVASHRRRILGGKTPSLRTVATSP